MIDNVIFYIDFYLILSLSGEWKPIFNQNVSTKQRISVMQIALPNEIFLLDLLHFFHNCDPEIIQRRLADRLFDDDHVTLLCNSFSNQILSQNRI